ncbi:MAG: hypothetical protein CL758_08085 [Chloroflexi bacterium]|nr:hypothetical protein [Chloroflexota bacterium]
MQIDNDRFREEINKELSSQTRPTITVLSSLLAIQDKFGYIPELAIDVIAQYTEHTINEVWGVASFYPNFRFTKPGENMLEICWGPTCHLAGSSKILNDIQEALGLDGEGETINNKFTLKYNTCLGACSQAPVISINHDFIGNSTSESVLEKLSKIDPKL